MKKMRNMIRQKFHKIVIVPVTFLGVTVANKMCVFASGTLGENAKNITTTTQTEAVGLVEVAGVLGLVVSGICIVINQRKLALGIFTSTVLGYFILKFSPQIWNLITGGM